MLITSKFESWCNRCGRIQIKIGDRCEWVKGVKGVMCLPCLGAAQPQPIPKTSRHPPRRPDVHEVVRAPELPPALAALDALETQFVRMAAKTATPTIDAAWTKYEKVKALALGSRVAPEQRVALKTAIVVLVTAIFSEECAYVV